jgi:protein-S-isoprenylcysteine O-methyltransferase Ste14
MIASIQMMALYLLWTPLGPIWWEAQGMARIPINLVYFSSWLFLARTMYDAGISVQTGFLGWSSVFRGTSPDYGQMPERGTFRFVRQPIYLAFALTEWTVPTWTPDQLMLAIWFTAYCLLGPLLKEKRYARRYGQKFEAYKELTPYFFPRLRWLSPTPGPAVAREGESAAQQTS